MKSFRYSAFALLLAAVSLAIVVGAFVQDGALAAQAPGDPAPSALLRTTGTLPAGGEPIRSPKMTLRQQSGSGSGSALFAVQPGWVDLESRNSFANALGDLDNDGDLDMVVGTGAGRQGIRVFLNQNGRLVRLPLFDDGPMTDARDVALADLDRDGKLDLLVTLALPDATADSVADPPILIYRNATGSDGNLKFEPVDRPLLLPSASMLSDPTDLAGRGVLAVGDLDGDAWLDIIFGTKAGMRVFYYAGDETQIQFAPESATSSCTTAENEFELEDIALGNLHQSFHASASLADMDDDGDLDLALGSEFTISIWRNDDGCLTRVDEIFLEQTLREIAWGDMNGDDLPDLAVGIRNGVNRVLINANGTLPSVCDGTTASGCWMADRSTETFSISWGDADGDGDLDLAVGNRGNEPNMVYLNEGGQLAATPAWQDSVTHETYQLKWGDMDNDGDLELVAAIYAEPDLYYTNLSGSFAPDAADFLADPDMPGLLAQDVALGDYDRDNDLDLAIAYAVNTGCDPLYGFNPDQDAIQNAGSLECWSGAANVILKNEGGVLQDAELWRSDAANPSTALAWGDVNADGWLDLVVGNVDGSIELYFNQEGGMSQDPSCLAERSALFGWPGAPKPYYFPDAGDGAALTSLALADVNLDGYLDAAVGFTYGVNRLYQFDPARNCFIRGDWTPDADPATPETDPDFTYDLAWGDIDNDGDLDLAVGNSADQLVSVAGNRDLIYRNVGGRLEDQPYQAIGWQQVATGEVYGFPTRALAWGDVDGDGDLDLATAAWSARKLLYRNDNGFLQPTPIWESADSDLSSDIVWLDADSDGDLDLAVANVTLFGGGTRNDLYLNDRGGLSPVPDWQSTSVAQTLSIAWGDVNLDGRNDLIFGNQAAPIEVYPGRRGGIHDALGLSSMHVALKTDPVETAAGHLSELLAPADAFAVPHVRATGIISIPFALENDKGRRFQAVYGRYSPNGTNWRPANSVQQADEHDPCPYAAEEHVFRWQTIQGGRASLYGQSDALVVQLGALPCYVPMPHDVAGSYQRALVTAQTYPFRARGTQVRVVNASGGDGAPVQPLENALVFRMSKASSGRGVPLGAGNALPYRTDAQGYLAGNETLNRADDMLVAMVPISETHAYILYQTSEMEGQGLTAEVVQEVAISTTNPLYLFNLDVSLEWDAGADGIFLSDLEQAFVRASDILYDVSEGQVALGEVRIYHGRQNWLGSDIVIYASNNQRPRASMGGVVLRPLDDPSGKLKDVYQNGQIRMGPVWDPYGQDRTELSEDWAKALAHELGHYLLFLPDNYLGVDREAGVVRYIDCPGSFMTHAYESDYSEMLTQAEWEDETRRACKQSMAELLTGRSDWETALAFYPMLKAPTAGHEARSGPSAMPLALPQVFFAGEYTPTQHSTLDSAVLPSRFIDLRDGNLQSVEKVESADVYLYKTRNPNWPNQLDQTPEDDSLIWLGSTGNGDDRIKVRGASRGDRLCIIVAESSPQRINCKEVSENLTSIEYFAVDGAWQPAISVDSPDGRHITVTVTLPAAFLDLPAVADKLHAQIFSQHGPISTSVDLTSPVAPMVQNGDSPTATQSAEAGARVTYTARFTVEEPTYGGYVRVWADKHYPYLESVAQYAFIYQPDPDAAQSDDVAAFGANFKQYGRLYNPYSFFGSGFGPNNQGFGPNNQGFGPNNQGFGPNNQGFGPNNQGFGPNNQGFGPNNQGFGPNNQGFGPNNQGFGPNNQGFGPNNQGFGPNNQGFGPNNQGFGPNNQGFGPNNQGFGPNNQGFGPNNQGFGPNNQGFGPNNQGFGPNNQGFGPNNQGFGPNNQGFGPNNQGFGPNNQGFGPNNQGFGPNNQGFGPNNQGFGPNNQGFGPNNQSFNVNRAWGANRRSLEAPVASGDGRITIFQVENIQADPGIAALVSLPVVPGTPSWFTKIGPAYRLINNEEGGGAKRSLAFQYLQREVPDGAEDAISIYFSPDEGLTWERLSTLHDRDENFAAARLPAGPHGGEGIYALFATVEMPELQEGWNVFGYPLASSRSVSEVLRSLAGVYTTVYAYDAASGAWLVHHPPAADAPQNMADLVNDLKTLDFAQTYWIEVSEPITPYLPIDQLDGDQMIDVSELADPPLLPPATYFGAIQGLDAAVDDTIVARVGEQICGTGRVVARTGGLAYRIHVSAATDTRACGADDREVRFTIDDRELATAPWQGPGVHLLNLSDEQ